VIAISHARGPYSALSESVEGVVYRQKEEQLRSVDLSVFRFTHATRNQ